MEEKTRKTLRTHVASVAERLGFAFPGENWSGVDAVWPLLERMREEGAVVLVKLDGERTRPSDAGPYTALASGGPLEDAPLRTDARAVEEALAYVICHYAEKCWGIPLPSSESED